MASERFDPGELRAVAAALSDIERQCTEILAAGDSPLANERYAALKAQLTEAAKHSTADGRRRELTRAEEVFYRAPLRWAKIELRPRHDLSPRLPKFQQAVSGARSEVQEALRKLAQHLPDA